MYLNEVKLRNYSKFVEQSKGKIAQETIFNKWQMCFSLKYVAGKASRLNFAKITIYYIG